MSSDSFIAERAEQVVQLFDGNNRFEYSQIQLDFLRAMIYIAIEDGMREQRRRDKNMNETEWWKKNHKNIQVWKY